MLYGDALFHAGIGVMCTAAGLLVLSVMVFSITGKRLERLMDRRYGKKRHDL